MRDLSQVRTAYERGEGSQRELAERFKVPLRTLARRAAIEKWEKQRIPISAMPLPVFTNKTTAPNSPRKPDWDKVREAYLELRSQKLVGEMFGIKADTVKTRARRHGWRNLAPRQSSPQSDPKPDYAHLAYLAYTGFLENLARLASEHRKETQQ